MKQKHGVLSLKYALPTQIFWDRITNFHPFAVFISGVLLVFSCVAQLHAAGWGELAVLVYREQHASHRSASPVRRLVLHSVFF